MRAWFAILLMIAVSLQFAWAAVASYCGHEATPSGTPTHLGHHAHKHEGERHAQAHQGESKASQLQAELDHGHCHLASAVVVAELNLSLAPAAPPAPQATRLPVSTPHIPDGLERPNWQRA